MRAGSVKSHLLGSVAFATGMMVLLAVLFIALFYTIDGPFGTLNDILNGFAGILSGGLAWLLFKEVRVHSFTSRAILLLALLGAVIVVIGSILIIFDITGWVLAGWYTTVGFALIGPSLLLFNNAARQNQSFPRNVSLLGSISGSIMMVGLLAIPGILMKIDLMETTPWHVSLGYLGFFGTYLLYPVWALWFSRIALSKPTD